MKLTHLMIALTAGVALVNCQKADSPMPPAAQASTATPASPTVIAANKAVGDYLDFSDRTDFELAERGFIATFDDGKIMNADGSLAYDFGAYDFLGGDAPASVNPSLWRQSQLAAKHGLFEVTDGIYQVRAYDLSNITFIAGDTGWIVVDPLISRETAARAKALVDRELGERPISAIIFTHSHVDHYGGVRGLIDEDDIANGVRVIAPDGFVRESISENILAGNAMARRASYMFGGLLPRGPEAQVGVGLGPGISTGTAGLLYPTDGVRETGETLTVDGIEMEFIMALESEAPS